ncbi:ABC transporter substrate-binding protein [Rhodococcus sp. (in: high G+C Gram-positive bacteria)]|uniref:ABC transporter substrate-binding protein n=1 Tax=Rhodococcus sp. TaxID=1831 RepID=UPI00257B5B9F|nr:ABC transporter substrate-binding protein [Rhodococcus sp. (in: high G+C Gram-positive bacteria)]MBQ7803640.1 ABC transporter substrate-binding protein [Rhodococcus sp. (in: high G+C Gram-positive bacteria)]
MKARSVPTAALVTIGVLTVASCGSTSDPGGNSSGDYAKDGSFTTIVNADPGNLHPLITNLIATQTVNTYTNDSLIAVDPKTRAIGPYLAEKWTDEGTTLTFTLKKGITCEDGSTFTAQTAADNINWVVDSKNGSPWLGASVPESTVAVADGDVLTVTTAEPAPFLLERIGALKLACKAALDDPASVRNSSNGTGLFRITEVVANDHVTLERRDGYNWGPNGETTSDTLGVPKTVTIKVVTDPATSANLVLTGSVNAAAVGGPDLERVESTGLDSMAYTTLSGQFIFNHSASLPTNDKAVRAALVQSIDLDDYTEINTGEKGFRATALAVVDPRACDYDSVAGVLPKFDMAAAKKTLADAGWHPGPDGILAKDGQPLSLNVIFNNTRDTTSAAAEYALTQWKELGAKVELRGGDNNFIISNSFAAKDLTSWSVSIGLTVQSDTPSIFVPYFSGPIPPEGVNFASMNNAKYTELATKASGLPGQESCAVWKEAEQALFADSDIIPVSASPNYMFFNGAESLYVPSGGILVGPGVRVLK